MLKAHDPATMILHPNVREINLRLKCNPMEGTSWFQQKRVVADTDTETGRSD